ncbi:MAG: hypothetical protein JWP91_1248 [Fibrobacteres bacterium]|nr:hypothetical protein [Fibrobacterota bacterium]
MVSAETLQMYRSFLEFRLLLALERRSLVYESDVTLVLTGAISDLGRHLGFEVTLERRYHAVPENLAHRCDVHWSGDADHIWEIDRTIKYRSANKLMGAREPVKIWVLWAKDSDLISLRLLDVNGIEVLVLGHEVRKLVWARLAAEGFERRELHFLLNHEDPYAGARELEGRMRTGPGEGDPLPPP